MPTRTELSGCLRTIITSSRAGCCLWTFSLTSRLEWTFAWSATLLVTALLLLGSGRFFGVGGGRHGFGLFRRRGIGGGEESGGRGDTEAAEDNLCSLS